MHFESVREQLARTDGGLITDVVAFFCVEMLDRASAHVIDAADVAHIAESPADIALRELLRLMHDAGRLISVVPLAASQNALPKLGGAAIKIFRPFAKQGLPARGQVAKPSVVALTPDTVDISNDATTGPLTIYPAYATPYAIGDIDYVAAAQTELVVVGLRLLPTRDQRVATYNIIVADRNIGVTGVPVDIAPVNAALAAAIAERARVLHGWSVDDARVLAAELAYAAESWADLSVTGSRRVTRAIAALRARHLAVPSAPAPMPPDVDDGPFLQMASAAFGRISLLQPNLTGELAAYGLLPAYIASLVAGADNKRTRALFDAEVEVRSNSIAAAAAVKTKLAERERFDARMYILSRMLTPVRYNVVRRADNETKLRTILTAAELEALNTEYDAQMRYAAAALDNKCGHIPLYKTFRRAVAFIDKKKAWDALAPFVNMAAATGPGKPVKGKRPATKGVVGSPNPVAMYTCNKCGFPLVCPHYIAYVRLTVSGASARDIRDTLAAYVADGSRADEQKCRICYEVMFSRFDLADDVVGDDSFNDDIRRAVYVEAAQFMQFVRFKQPVDLPGLIAQLRDVIYPYAIRIDTDLKRTQSITSNDVAVQRNAYIAMIVAAKIVQLMARSGKSSGGGQMFFEAAPKLRTLRELTDHAAGIVAMTKTTILRDISGITRTVIRDRIALGIEAFGDSVDVRPEAEQADDPESFAERIVHDPTFAWIEDATGRHGFAQVMGHRPAELFAKIGSGVSVYRDARDGPVRYKSAYLTDLFREHMKIAHRGESRIRVESIGASDQTKSPKHAAASHAWNAPRRRSALRLCHALHGNAQFRDVQPPIGVVYDENGELHDWSLYNIGDAVYSADQLAKLGMDSARLAEIAPNGIRESVIDRTCSVCGVRASLAAKLDQSRVRAGIAAAVNIASFYRFYDQRCPKGDLHELAAAGSSKLTTPTPANRPAKQVSAHVCSKCGMNIAWKTDLKSTDALNYYRTFKDQFEIDHDLLAPRLFRSDIATPAATAHATATEAVSWNENFADVTAIAEIAGIHPRVIQAFGAYEGTSIDAISTGAYTPSHTDNRDDARVLAVNAIVGVTLAAWDRVRNYNTIKNHTQYTIDIVGKTPRALLDGLVDVTSGYDELYRWSYWSRKPEQTVALCIQEWCSRLLRIWNEGNADTEALRHEFVRSQIRLTIAGQDLFTERQPFNWAIIYGRKDAPDVIEDFDPQEESVRRDKMFSTDAFDMDGEVEIRAGENLGLT